MQTLNWIGEKAGVNHHRQIPFRLLSGVLPVSCGEMAQTTFFPRATTSVGYPKDMRPKGRAA